ncbi:MAG: hypothetical protein PWP28_2100 [Oceanotoga sp.]|jgi:hypothetical protein|nr:hypothetical protein [Oceanotoga sp.]
MVPLNIFLSHFITDFAFSNVYSEKFLNKKTYYLHLIWAAVVFLSFNFELLNSKSFYVLILSFIIHILFDLIRIKKNTTPLFEFIGLIIFFILNYIFKSHLEGSFLTNNFQLYILGLMITTSFLTYIFRIFEIYPREKKDTAGTTERLVIFIFILSQNFLFAIISGIIGIIYKYLFEKFRKKEIILSPILGLIISYIWLIIMK